MTDQEAIKYLAHKIGEMHVLVAARYQIKYWDNLGAGMGMFGFMPEYGETFDEALKNVILAKFGKDYLKIAEKMHQDEKVRSKELANHIIEKNPWLKAGN